MFSRVSKRQAQEILREEISKFESHIDFMMDIKTGPRLEANELAWWRKNYEDNESSTTDRNIAFLRAYVRIGGPRLYAQGLGLSDRGSVYMDRSVIRRLERDAYLSFVEAKASYFVLTPKGAELIAE